MAYFVPNGPVLPPLGALASGQRRLSLESASLFRSTAFSPLQKCLSSGTRFAQTSLAFNGIFGRCEIARLAALAPALSLKPFRTLSSCGYLWPELALVFVGVDHREELAAFEKAVEITVGIFEQQVLQGGLLEGIGSPAAVYEHVAGVIGCH